MKTVFITGASTGLGLAISKIFHDNGRNVIGTSLYKKDIINFQAKCPNGTIIMCDLRKESEIIKAVNDTIKRFGTINLLINNAAVKAKGPIEKFSIDFFNEVIQVNLVSIYSLVSKFLPYLSQNKSSRIINVSSTIGKYAAPYRLPYATTKHAISAFGQSLQRELIDKNIDVGITTVFPGGMNTPWVDKKSENYLEPEDVADSIYYIATRSQHILIPEFSIVPRGDKYI